MPIFGNHDNESKKGVTWQCEIFENSPYCLFKRNNLTGNGNYNIGLFVNNKLKRVIYMIDSNGCWFAYNYGYVKEYPPYNQNEKVQIINGIYQDQVAWIEKTSNKINNIYGNVNKFICTHIAPSFVNEQAIKNKYQKDNEELFVLGETVTPINGDFGVKGERFPLIPCYNLLEILKKCNFDGMFVAHSHNNSLSILCDDFSRVTFTLKTSISDYHKWHGGTVVTLKDNNFGVEHLYIDSFDVK